MNTIKHLYTNNKQIFAELKYTETISSKYKKHFHTHFGITLIDKGSLKISYDKYAPKELNNCAIAIFNPLQVHFTESLTAQGYYVLFLDKEWCKSLQDNIFISDTIINDSILYMQFKILFKKILTGHICNPSSVLEKIMKDFFQNHGSIQIKKETTIVRKIKALVEENSDTSFSLEDVSRSMGYNKSYIVRLFKKEVGLTPQQYILNVKVNKAKDFLTYATNESLSNISVNTGFFDQSHFNRNFESTFGTSPKMYKKVNIVQDNHYDM